MSHSKKRSVFDLGVTAEEQEEGEDGQPPAKKKLRETTTADDSSSAATATTAAESSAADKTGAYPKRPKHVQKPPPASDRPTTNQHRPIERCSEEQQRSAEQSLMLLWDNVYERDATPLVSAFCLLVGIYNNLAVICRCLAVSVTHASTIPKRTFITF